MSHHRPNQTFYLDQSTLQCKAGCGFFGNPEWSGYCSICFKLNDTSLQQQQQQHRQQYQQQMQYYQQQQMIQQQQHQQLLHRQQQREFHEQQRLYFLQSQQQEQELARSQQEQLRNDIDGLRKPIQPGSIATSNGHNQPAASTSSPKSQDTLSALSSNSNLFSPTSLVQMGYDTLTNLHHTIKSSFRSSPSASADMSSISDTSSIHSTSQSEYQVGRRSSGRRHWTSIINTGRKASLAESNNFQYDLAWDDCLNHTNRFARDFLQAERRPDKTINDLSDMIHDFYERMARRFDGLIYRGATQDQLELLNDNMERILSEHIYHVISARIINEDEDHNMAVQRRIRSLNWVTVEHLEIEIDFQRPIVHDLLDKAICQIVEMNPRTSSIDKLECIVQCSKTIFELLQVGQPNNVCDSSSNIDISGDNEKVSQNNDTTRKIKRKHVPTGADQFLPVLVFVVIQANPPMLPADMKYLTRFSNPRRLMSGETGYYFTNLCCALEFIEKASGASLNISEEDFNKFVNGQAVPETRSQFHTYLSDNYRRMRANLATLDKLVEGEDAQADAIDELSKRIDEHMISIEEKHLDMQKSVARLEDKLKPKLPDWYIRLKETDPERASRLWPPGLGRTSTG